MTHSPAPSSALQESSDANSKFHQFGTGDLETLNKPGVRDALVAFHQRYYSANQMRLCIYGKESIADLEVCDHSRLAGQPPTLTHPWLSMPHHTTEVGKHLLYSSPQHGCARPRGGAQPLLR